MQKPKISKIYLDMDGVIANFNKRYIECYQMEPRESEKHKAFDRYFDEFISNREFENLDLMPGSEDGLEFLRKALVPTLILSSTSNEERYDLVAKQKLIWLQKQGITFTPIFVPGKRFKKDYATPDSIIIDDTWSVVDDWRKAGGIGVWHRDWPSTIAILKMYV